MQAFVFKILDRYVTIGILILGRRKTHDKFSKRGKDDDDDEQNNLLSSISTRNWAKSWRYK